MIFSMCVGLAVDWMVYSVPLNILFLHYSQFVHAHSVY